MATVLWVPRDGVSLFFGICNSSDFKKTVVRNNKDGFTIFVNSNNDQYDNIVA